MDALVITQESLRVTAVRTEQGRGTSVASSRWTAHGKGRLVMSEDSADTQTLMSVGLGKPGVTSGHLGDNIQ